MKPVGSRNFGGLFAESTNTDLQPYMYNGKELDRMHALDWYDFGARHYDAALLRWHSMDPLCEKYYHISPYAFCANNFVNAFDLDGRDWVVREYDGKDEYYFDREVRSAEAFHNKYGNKDNMRYIADGTKVTLDGSEYVFSNEGNGSVSIDGAKKDDYPILYGDKYTIFGTADESCNGETVHQNWYGSYTGPKNPKNYNKEYSYQYPPQSTSEWGSYIHDRLYDIAEAKGTFDALFNNNKTVITADKLLYQYNSLNVLNGNTSIEDRIVSAGTAIAFWGLYNFKKSSTFFIPLSIYTCVSPYINDSSK